MRALICSQEPKTNDDNLSRNFENRTPFASGVWTLSIFYLLIFPEQKKNQKSKLETATRRPRSAAIFLTRVIAWSDAICRLSDVTVRIRVWFTLIGGCVGEQKSVMYTCNWLIRCFYFFSLFKIWPFWSLMSLIISMAYRWFRY